MRKGSYVIKVGFLAVLYWLAESMIHRFIYHENQFEIIPSNIDELWMRVLIVILLIGFGVYADRNTRMMIEKEKEKRIIFNASVHASQHIVNNLLNQMKYFKMQAEQSNIFDVATKDLYEQTIRESEELIKNLGAVDEINVKTINRAVHPELKLVNGD